MKKYQTLKISGSPASLFQFKQELVANLHDWQHNTELTERAGLGVDCLALNVPARVNSRNAMLFLMTPPDAIEYVISNVIPSDGQLSEEEYNAILKAFSADCIVPLAARHNLTIKFSKEEVFVEETLSVENMSKLQEFARMANKSTGASHPDDYVRWISFISVSVKDNQIVEPALLQMWLMEQGFPDYIAYELMSQYQFGTDLIQHIESQRSLRSELETAASDPLFLADMQEIEEAFRSADKQTASMLDNDWTALPTTQA